MADRRRRRRRASQDSEDDDESGSGSDSGKSGSPTTKSRVREPEPPEVTATRPEPKPVVESECESEDGVGEAVLSDYDSADPEENGSHSEGVEEEEEAEQFSDEEAPAASTEPKPSTTAEERQSGDGQESTDDPETKAGGIPGQKLDDDEDRKNPAYIPRKGLFFEHDVRGHAQEEERPKGRNRKLWKDEGRWDHDRFREEEQAPKSREELIAIYGYDIRNGGGSGERPYRQRRPRQSLSPGRDKRWGDGGERPVRSCGAATPPDSLPPAADHPTPSRIKCNIRLSQYRNNELNAPQMHPRERPGPKAQCEPTGDRGVVSRGGRGGGRAPSVLVEDITFSQGGSKEADPGVVTTSQQVGTDQSGSLPPCRAAGGTKSYSAARRTRSRPSDLGSKQPSVEDSAAGGNSSSPGDVGGKSWSGEGNGPSQAGGGGGLGEQEKELARLSLVGQSWSPNPTSYFRSEMRGLPNTMHIPGSPPQFSNIEESRTVPEPAPPIHLGVMEGHYYEPMSYQGPIYAHGDGPAPIPPQSMLVQPEMHMPHPGLHPHQSGGPIANPALYGGPPVSLPPPPGQPQQLLPPPFYPPPGVMTFPYPTMYPTQQGQAQVYGGVTYYDTMQQHAQPKPSPPRRTSQPVTIKPPPPELRFASE
ncbi:Protein CASC3 [Dissostichus eleginoides]|uniref:Protein CASC3 n=1 Tax=Dissostichus eleginoides TaxID=100907 RepID=A0AAD9B773_DISEL|nr:Protein CASC3 [Dissostichus eleginoides]